MTNKDADFRISIEELKKIFGITNNDLKDAEVIAYAYCQLVIDIPNYRLGNYLLPWGIEIEDILTDIDTYVTSSEFVLFLITNEINLQAYSRSLFLQYIIWEEIKKLDFKKRDKQ